MKLLIFFNKNVETFEENIKHCKDCICYPNNVCICKHCDDKEINKETSYNFLQKRYCNPPSNNKWQDGEYTRHKVVFNSEISKEDA